MDTNIWVTIVQTVGFPIAMCLAMALYVKYISDKSREERIALADQHKEEMLEIMSTHRAEVNELKSAINSNTLVMQKLCDKLENTP